MLSFTLRTRGLLRLCRTSLKAVGKWVEACVKRAMPGDVRDAVRPFFSRFKQWRHRRRRMASCDVRIAHYGHEDGEAGSSLRIVLLVAHAGDRARLAVGCCGDWCRLEDPREYRAEPSDYVVIPTSATACLAWDELRAAYLALGTQPLDLVIVSRGLDPAPTVRAFALRDVAVVRADLRPYLESQRPFPNGLRGRVLRSARAVPDADAPGVDLAALLGRPCCVSGQTFTTGTVPGRAAARLHGESLLPLDRAPTGEERPLMLVLPGLFAVGGVERNTIEVMRALASRYRFVVVTNEPLDPVRGSLHRQLDGLCEGVYDLGEIAPAEDHLELLRQLDARHGFDCMWIVNGSTWLSDNLAALRQAFADIPIVDQQVYDTTHGWISNYQKPEIRAFDRHIAINRKIADAFVQRYSIAAERVRLIYHAIDGRCWEAVAGDRHRGAALRAAWGLPAGVPLYACIGRLTAQKQPLDFLDLARRSQADGRPDVFALVGDGELGESCRQFVSHHGLKNVIMPGFMDQPGDLFAAVDGLVITSAYEGLPIVSLEAMAAGLPVLATDVGDLRLVGETHGSITLFTAAEGDGRYAEFLRWCGNLPAHTSRARERAAGVRAAFGVDEIAGQYATLFDEALGLHGRPGRRRSAAAGGAGVSVVMPTFNRIDTLEMVLASYARCMDGLDCELIVVDDGSNDGTTTLLERVSRADNRVRFTTLPNGGPARARNVGASMARKDVVLFVGDDILPRDDRFVRAHAELHDRHGDEGFAVLGKVVWPIHGPAPVTAVMRHIQGVGGEQFGYAHMRPYGFYDWRFFYTCNVSVKRRIVTDWMQSGFSTDFPAAAFEDGEFAYRMQRRPSGLRIYYDPASCGEHHHSHTVRSFIERQFAAGMMAAIFVEKHPAAAPALRLQSLMGLMKQPPKTVLGQHVGDVLSVIEGIKSFAILLEARGGLGDQHWHTGFLQALFEMVMMQGFVAGWAPHTAAVDAGYESVLAGFLRHMEQHSTVEAPLLELPMRHLRHGLRAA